MRRTRFRAVAENCRGFAILSLLRRQYKPSNWQPMERQNSCVPSLRWNKAYFTNPIWGDGVYEITSTKDTPDPPSDLRQNVNPVHNYFGRQGTENLAQAQEGKLAISSIRFHRL